jgi:hypothetical protein
MLQKEFKDVFERDNIRRKQAALQTKTQKRWRAKGVDLDVLMNEYSHELLEKDSDELEREDSLLELSYR